MGSLKYPISFLKQLPIKSASSEEKEQIGTAVQKILSITDDDDYLDNPDKQAEVKRLEEEIDQLVYKLYDLTPEEIEIVEEFTAEHQSKKRGRKKR